MCFLGGARDWTGVSYKMLLTAAGADHDGGWSEVGRGEMRRCSALYARAEVEDDCARVVTALPMDVVLGPGRSRARVAAANGRRAAILAAEGSQKAGDVSDEPH